MVTYSSGDVQAQVDYILTRKSQRTLFADVTVIPGKECDTQHKLLVCAFKIELPIVTKRSFVAKLRLQKLKERGFRETFNKTVTNNFSSSIKNNSVYGLVSFFRVLKIYLVGPRMVRGGKKINSGVNLLNHSLRKKRKFGKFG